MSSAENDRLADHDQQPGKRAAEREKWDAYYKSLGLVEEDDLTKHFNAELVASISDLLPEGGTTLECGSGGGWQSLALARTGRFATSLLDFSAEALSYAKRVFQREGLTAEFIQSDIEAADSSSFDLVFNAGVLEHYNSDEQVSLIRGMAARSRRYVMVLVPNRDCYWYWAWRLGRSSQGEWPWGKEVPASGMRSVFERSGLDFLGHAYFGSKWTESFISELTVSSPALGDLLLAVHRAPLGDLRNKAYLVAGLGRIHGEAALPSGWRVTDDRQSDSDVAVAALADALAVLNHQTSELRALRQSVRNSEASASAQAVQSVGERDLAPHEKRSLIRVIDSISAQASALENERRDLNQRLAQLEEAEVHKTELDAELLSVRQSLASTQRLLETTHAELEVRQKRNEALVENLEVFRQKLTSAENREAERARLLAAEQTRADDAQRRYDKLKKSFVTAGLDFEMSLQSLLDSLRGQRAWRIMLAIRKAYSLWTRHGLRGKMRALAVPFDLIADPRHSLVEYDPKFPSVLNYWSEPGEGPERTGAENPLRNTPAKLDIIILPIFDFEFRFQRPQQIAAQFARAGHRVFWVSPSRFINASVERQFETVLLRENLYEVRVGGRELRIYTDALPSKRAEEVTDALMEVYREFGVSELAVLVQFPFWRDVALKLRKSVDARIVYDCMDDWRNWTAEPRISDFSLQEEHALAKECDVLVATSAALHDRIQAESGRSALRLRNGADFDFFQDAQDNSLLGSTPRPIIGYYGAIADWVDVDLMTDLAQMRPRYSFVIIGEVHAQDVSRLAQMPNVQMLGERNYTLIPSYLRHFDACLFPFKQNRLTNAVDPVKVYEYLSQGKPVVATPIPDVREHGSLVYFAETAAEFASQLDRALAESPELKSRRIAYAESNSWAQRTECLTTAIEGTYPMVSILAVSYNSREFLPPFLDSVRRNTAYPRYELIVLDNASTDGGQEVLLEYEKTFPNLRTILSKTNLGFAAGNNAAARNAQGEFLVLLNVDTVVTWGWLGRLLRPLNQRPNVGMTAPATNFSGNETRIQTNYRTLSEMERFALDRASAEFNKTRELDMVPLLCAALPRRIWNEVGELDERFGAGMFEDDDYCARITNAGYKILAVEDCFIHHFGNGSFGKVPSGEALKLFAKNRSYFESKWKTTWKGHKMREGVRPLSEDRQIPVSEFLAKSDVKPEQIPAPVRLRLLPDRTTVGSPINPQPSGDSALVVECDNPTPDTIIRFGGELLQTSYGRAGVLSAILPGDFNRSARGIPVCLVNNLGESDSLVFRVDG